MWCGWTVDCTHQAALDTAAEDAARADRAHADQCASLEARLRQSESAAARGSDAPASLADARAELALRESDLAGATTQLVRRRVV